MTGPGVAMDYPVIGYHFALTIHLDIWINDGRLAGLPPHALARESRIMPNHSVVKVLAGGRSFSSFSTDSTLKHHSLVEVYCI